MVRGMRLLLALMFLGMLNTVAVQAQQPPQRLSPFAAEQNWVAAPNSPTSRRLPPRTGAATTPKTDAARQRSEGLPSVWTTLAALACVVCLVVGVAKLLRKHVPVGLRGLPPEALEPLGKRVLEPRLSIHLVRCGSRILVLGASPDGLRTLAEINDPLEVDLLAGYCRPKDNPRGVTQSFRSLFRKQSGFDEGMTTRSLGEES